MMNHAYAKKINKFILGEYIWLPKRRQSKSRSKKRRTHYKSGLVSTTTCAQCGATKMPHRACPSCGYYRGRPVVSSS